ncbi:uncharacterized protein N7515_005190 [Penicillium bovifimosum]|uniref:Fungal lipase-type domain-containing protein n=1 Tax=Penicillium bovifimosum TaxID=126998 RepID=A0A9W9GSL1_9EURO|nr:uncharacterized protein N7515_005190 [Penicillium bovifimosum]KAJ5129151.1 hypothetical protein N7515_005190 [Penicillium bovifimosum]
MVRPIMRLILAVLSLSVTAVATPVPLARREISSELLERFTLFSQFAAVSACDQNINHTGQSVTCDFGNCEFVEADNTTVIDIFHSTTGPTGYIALDHTRQLIVLAFRGTISKHDSEIDFKINLSKIDICEGCLAHEGFLEYWQAVEDQATSKLKQATQEYQDYRLSVVGHSLGAAVATLAGASLRKHFTLDMWTFGSPKPGNKKLAEFITSQQPPDSVYRVTHAADLVPKIPPTGIIFDWSQPSPEYWIDQETGQQVTTAVVKRIEGINSKEGNEGTAPSSPIWPSPDHGWYFGNLSVCADPADKGH